MSSQVASSTSFLKESRKQKIVIGYYHLEKWYKGKETVMDLNCR